MNQATATFTELLIFSGATIASAIGFLASITLYSYAKFRVRPNRQALRCLYQYAAVFFAGTSLLCVDWIMGDRAPIPLKPPLDDQARIGFAALMCVWMLAVIATFMAHRTWRVVRKGHTTPEGRNLVQARNLFAQGRLVHGRRISRHRHRRHPHGATA